MQRASSSSARLVYWATLAVYLPSALTLLWQWMMKVNSQEERLLAQILCGGALVLAQVVPVLVCRILGVSLERQVVSPLPIPPKEEVVSSAAELRSFVQTETFRALALMFFAGSLLVLAAEFYAVIHHKARIPLEAVVGIPLMFVCLAGGMALLSHLNRCGTFLAQADENGINSNSTPVEVPWSQITNVVQVENFNVFGNSTSKTLELRDASGEICVRVLLGQAPQNQQHKFIQTLAHYLKSTETS